MRVLVADDKPSLRESLSRALALEGYDVKAVEDGRKALHAVKREQPDLIILDLLMPGLDGFEVCRSLRLAGDFTPVLMLTVRDRVADRVAGLDAGADDYLVKPFALEELLARVRSLIRRSSAATDAKGYSFEDLVLVPSSRQAWRGDVPLSLTKTEFDLLALFMAHPRQVLTRSVIMDRVWGFDLGESSNALAVYVGYLRGKMEQEGGRRLIHTVRGVGYVLRDR